MKDNRMGHKELLVAHCNKGYGKIHRQMWYIPKNEKSHRSTNREFEVEQGSIETMNTPDSRLYQKVTISS